MVDWWWYILSMVNFDAGYCEELLKLDCINHCLPYDQHRPDISPTTRPPNNSHNWTFELRVYENWKFENNQVYVSFVGLSDMRSNIRWFVKPAV